MSELDYIEALNNKELRAECIKYGLPNVPVTDSSRSVLIRRLRATIDGPAAAISPKPANRRETLPKPQTRSVELVDAVARNRRTTTDTAASLDARTRSTPVTRTVDARRGINSSKSGSNLGALETPPRSRSVSLSKSDVVTTSYRQEREQKLPEAMEVDEDIIDMADNEEHYDRTRYNYLNTQKPSPRLPLEPQTARSPQAPRSRSVSLSKSGVVTTSYVQEIVPLASKAPEEYDEEYEDKNFMDDADYAQHSYYKQSPSTSVPAFRTPILNSTRYSGLDMTAPNRSYSTPTTHSTLQSNNIAGAYVAYEEQQSAEEEADDEPEAGQSSDDQQQQQGTKIYKSKYTRQLAQQQKGEQKPVRRRATHVANDESSVEDSLRQFFVALDRKYNLKQYIMMLVGLLLAVFLYVMFIEK